MITKDNKNIPARVWYYLLDWNEQDDWQTLRKVYEVDKLRDLDYIDVIQLFQKASSKDILEMDLNR